MASAGGSARRYAQAVFELGQEKGNLEAWLDDLELMADVFADRRVVAFFVDPKRRGHEKGDAAQRMFGGRIQQESLNLLQMLIDRSRVGIIPDVRDRLDRMILESQNIVEAQVTTAVPVDAAEEQRIAEYLGRLTGGKRVEVETRVDPEIIGGIIARVGDKLIDGSARTSLLHLRERLEAGR